ncbi:MAG: putative lipid II flippase FtsW [Verrucomicrobia bacterium]|nr:MAG: putative lipid II flippase FtsW [Verrucomicrobiota bacterium]
MRFLHRHSVHILLIAVFGLLVLGIVMLFSTSAFAQDSHGDTYYFVKRQFVWLGIGMFCCLAGALIDYHWWEKTWAVWLGISLLLLVLCFIPNIGMKINGSWRWINLRILVLQPSEITKLALVFFLAWWFSRFENHPKRLLMEFVAPAAVVSIPIVLIAKEVDLGTTFLILITIFLIMYVAGVSLRWLIPVAVGGLGSILFIALHMHERANRLLAFLHPEQYRLSEGLQQWQALIAFGSGGLQGLGLGEGRQKYLYLPYAHTDFIFAMIGEELGLVATLAVVFSYLLICLCGSLTSINAQDRFGTLLGYGLTMLVTIQAIINIGVTLSLLPNKGMPLPFISYGGSNLSVCLFAVGILINIHRMGRPLDRISPHLQVGINMLTKRI